MVEPHEKAMKMQWITVDGRSVPVVLPQIWDYELEDWVVTSADNPIPTQLTGSNVEDSQAIPTRMVSSNVQTDYLEDTFLSAGSFVTSPLIEIEGTRIGVGIRFTAPIEFQVRVSPKRKNSSRSVDSSANHVVLKSETPLLQKV